VEHGQNGEENDQETELTCMMRFGDGTTKKLTYKNLDRERSPLQCPYLSVRQLPTSGIKPEGGTQALDIDC
jgi:hypothetical protein